MYPLGLGTGSRGMGLEGITLAQAITKQENTNPIYNNPGALMSAPSGYCQNGKASNGMVIFCTPQDGQNALDNQIQIEANSGQTLASMMQSYAPASVSGNNPTGYTSNVASWTGIDPTVPLSSIDPSMLLASASAPNTSIDVAGNTVGNDPLTSLGDSVASLLGGDTSSVDWGMIGLGLLGIYLISRMV